MNLEIISWYLPAGNKVNHVKSLIRDRGFGMEIYTEYILNTVVLAYLVSCIVREGERNKL
jgi:hypothetical protein